MGSGAARAADWEKNAINVSRMPMMMVWVAKRASSALRTDLSRFDVVWDFFEKFRGKISKYNDFLLKAVKILSDAIFWS